jgi:uncharacterized protein YqjF (DUF2071 family)
MLELMPRKSHKPRPLPSGHWVLRQRWNDMLFANWPVPAALLAPLIPEGLQVDTFQGSAWLGVTPFWIQQIKLQGLPPIPGSRSFPHLSLRTYVRDPQTGTAGLTFLSLEASNPIAAAVGRAFYRLPYHWAQMSMEQRSEREFSFYSRRRFADRPVIFKARYRGLGPSRRLAESRAGTLEYFLMERYCLFSSNRDGRPIRANLHHEIWPLEEAEAEIEQNSLASALGITLPETEPVLYYSRKLAVYVWAAELMARPSLLARPVTVAATPTG